jgi:hypothetical protein
LNLGTKRTAAGFNSLDLFFSGKKLLNKLNPVIGFTGKLLDQNIGANEGAKKLLAYGQEVLRVVGSAR